MKPLIVCGAALLLSACANLHIEQSIKAYDAIADQVQLGSIQKEVLDMLAPVQQNLPQDERKRAEKYQEGDTLVEIYYVRAANFSDGLVTDDEFVPFVFHNKKLVGIGWQMLGGPKTKAQSQPVSTCVNTGWNYYY